MSLTESPTELLDRLQAEKDTPPAPRSFRLAVTGGRDYTPTLEEMRAFRRLFDELKPTELHHGGSRGVDAFVALWVAREYPATAIVEHRPDWNSLGKAAGPIRNREMMTRCEALAAFQGGRGTQNCVFVARQQGKAVSFVRA